MVKNPITAKSHCYTMLWYIVNSLHVSGCRCFCDVNISQGIVNWLVWGGVEYFIITLLQIYCKVFPWKCLENRSAFRKVRSKNRMEPFWNTVYATEIWSITLMSLARMAKHKISLCPTSSHIITPCLKMTHFAISHIQQTVNKASILHWIKYTVHPSVLHFSCYLLSQAATWQMRKTYATWREC